MFAAIDYNLFTVRRVCAPGILNLDAPDVRLRSITTSSLVVRPGSLFVPLIDRRDGHEFIADAVARAKLETRRYIKRQETWLRGQMRDWQTR